VTGAGLVTQYARGRAKEYRCMELLRRDGWIVGRSAASHSPVDIYAAREGKVLLVQVKSGKARISAEELRELVKWAQAFNADAEVWHFKGRGDLQKRRVFVARG
jgi:Holliday junction resolvase